MLLILLFINTNLNLISYLKISYSQTNFFFTKRNYMAVHTSYTPLCERPKKNFLDVTILPRMSHEMIHLKKSNICFAVFGDNCIETVLSHLRQIL